MSKKKLWPACLPKQSYSDKRGVFGGPPNGGWLVQEPFHRLSSDSLFAIEKKYLTLKAVQVRNYRYKKEFAKRKKCGHYL